MSFLNEAICEKRSKKCFIANQAGIPNFANRSHKLPLKSIPNVDEYTLILPVCFIHPQKLNTSSCQRWFKGRRTFRCMAPNNKILFNVSYTLKIQLSFSQPRRKEVLSIIFTYKVENSLKNASNASEAVLFCRFTSSFFKSMLWVT